MSVGAGLGYQATYPPVSTAPYAASPEQHRSYTDPYLTKTQHAAVILSTAFATSFCSRPIEKLSKFYFIGDVPGESTRYSGEKLPFAIRTIYQTKWLAGPPLWRNAAEYAIPLGVFVWLREALEVHRSAVGGIAAGAMAGVSYAVLRHPFDVLRATAEVSSPARNFKGPIDVLLTALREKPSMLSGLYRGVSAAALGRGAQFGAQFGLYNFLRYDGVYRGPWMLYLYCFAAVFLGELLQYPFMSMRQQLRTANVHVKGRPLSYRAYFSDLRRRYGVTKVYEGFFTSKPFLRSVTPALFLFGYDLLSRRYTERLHPHRRIPVSALQSLTSREAPDYVVDEHLYDFGPSHVWNTRRLL